MAKKKKPGRKGFTRSAKEWEKSIATHIGHLIDNLKGEDILNLIAAGICSYAGYVAAKKLGADEVQAVGGAGSGLIAYQLAKSMNLVAGASGTAYLAGLGILDVWGADIAKIPQDTFEKAKAMPFPFGFGKADVPLHIP